MGQAIEVDIEGKVEDCYLCVIEEELSALQLRSTAITTHSPMHSYLFSHTGQLLYATDRATLKLKRTGCAQCCDVLLPLPALYSL